MPDLGILSLLPAAVALLLAVLTREVLAALFLGIVAGGVVLALATGEPSDLNPVTRFLVPRLATEGFAELLVVYLWLLGGLLGVWRRTGAATHFARTLGGRLVRSARSARIFTFLTGCVFHQGGTISTVLTGVTARPLARRHGLTPEEQALLVDTTGSPVAAVIPFNAWPSVVAAAMVGTVALVPDVESGIAWFFRSVPFNFYCWLAVVLALLVALGVRLPGLRRLHDPDRARRGRPAGDVPDADDAPPDDYRPVLADFLLPLSVLLLVLIVPHVWLETRLMIAEAFLAALLAALLLARLRGLPLRELLRGFLAGCQGMTVGALIIALALTLGKVSSDLGAPAYVAGLAHGLPPLWLPAALLAACMVISFATGTAFGTFSVVLPIAVPLATGLSPDPDFLAICIGAVVGGSIFGDHASPVSDTTVLASMFTGCDVMDHTLTQLPLCLLAAAGSAVLSTLSVLVFV